MPSSHSSPSRPRCRHSRRSRDAADDDAKKRPVDARAGPPRRRARVEATEISAERISAAQTEQAKLEAEIADGRGEDPGAAGAGRRAAASGQGARGAALRAARRATPHSSRPWTPRTRGRRSAPRTSPTPSATTTSTSAPSCKATAAELAEREAQLRAAARRPRRRRSTSLAPLNDLLQKKLQVASTRVRQGARARGRRPRRSTASDVATGATACPVKGSSCSPTTSASSASRRPVHPGIDMAALTDTPVVAVADGFMRHDVGGAGGNGAWLTGARRLLLLLRALLPLRGRGRTRRRGRRHRLRRHDRQRDRAAPPLRDPPGKPGENPPVDPFATLLVLLCATRTAEADRSNVIAVRPDGATG